VRRRPPAEPPPVGHPSALAARHRARSRPSGVARAGQTAWRVPHSEARACPARRLRSGRSPGPHQHCAGTQEGRTTPALRGIAAKGGRAAGSREAPRALGYRARADASSVPLTNRRSQDEATAEPAECVSATWYQRCAWNANASSASCALGARQRTTSRSPARPGRALSAPATTEALQVIPGWQQHHIKAFTASCAQHQVCPDEWRPLITHCIGRRTTLPHPSTPA
jgi:hypothetical protein